MIIYIKCFCFITYCHYHIFLCTLRELLSVERRKKTRVKNLFVSCFNGFFDTLQILEIGLHVQCKYSQTSYEMFCIISYPFTAQMKMKRKTKWKATSSIQTLKMFIIMLIRTSALLLHLYTFKYFATSVGYPLSVFEVYVYFYISNFVFSLTFFRLFFHQEGKMLKSHVHVSVLLEMKIQAHIP